MRRFTEVRGGPMPGPSDRSVRLTEARALLLVALAVACKDIPGLSSGDIQVAVTTTGADLDPDGYAIALDGATARPIPVNGTMTFSGLSTGSHTVVLSGIAPNCALSGPNARQADVTAGLTTQLSFTVACVALAPLNIAGVWDWTEQYVNPACHDTGTYVFHQIGFTFSGTSQQVGMCEGNRDNTSTDPVTGGVVSGGEISFRVGASGFCSYTAVISGDPPDRLNGTTICGNSTGTWAAVRNEPVASVTLTPPSGTLLEQHTLQLAVQLRDAAGRRLFGRAVVWSSDNPKVATVSDSGKVTAVAAGTATITATAGGTSGTAQITVERAGAVRATTATTGVDLDLDGYRVFVDGSWDGSRAVAISGAVTLTGIAPGSHTILLGNVSSNCTVAGPNPVSITLAGGDTVAVTFEVACVRTQRIAFASSYYGGIYVMNADGQSAVQLITSATVTPYGHPTWSPDGTRIAFQSERDGKGNSEIYVMSFDGSGVTRLTDNPALDGEPAWSPDGTKIAFQSGRDGNAEIYVMNADGSGQVRLTNNPAADADPAWSPDGARIAFASNRDGNFEIYVMNADGSGVTRLTNNLAFDGEPAWSPDGTRIAFQSNRDGNPQIYVMSADGSGVTRLTNDYDSDWQPTWSPDGSRIAFTKNVQGCDYYDCWDFTSIYVMNADGSGVTQLIGTNTGLDSDPAWRP